MEKNSIISYREEVTAFQLIVGILLAVAVMLLINTLVGSLGGMPALTSFFCVYSILRFFYNGKPGISKEKEIKMLMLQFGIGYLLVWAGMNVVVFLSRFSGWGSIDGVTISEYLGSMFGSSMLEKWAYFFAGALMFIFIISLFPLVVIKRRKVWALYFLGDCGFFVLVCSGIAGICQNFFMEGNRRGGAQCVLDALLMCKMSEKWQLVLFLAGIILLGIFVLAAVFYISKINYGKEEKPEKPILVKENLFIPLIVALLLVAGGVGYFFFGDSSTTMSYHKIAECLTEDSYLGPMSYEGNVYLPAEEDTGWTEEMLPLGYLAYQGQNCDSRFYELAIGNLLYMEKGTLKNKLWMEGANQNFYRLAQDVEAEEAWKENSVFLMWDEEWEQQSSYSSGFTGYTVCDRTLVELLKEAYPQVSYNPEDFEEYDAYFTLQGYQEMPEGLEETSAMGNWVGCILVKDNKFYFGNCTNPILGEALELLLDTLGGYEHSQNMISTQE